jgi:hypothetical protein
VAQRRSLNERNAPQPAAAGVTGAPAASTMNLRSERRRSALAGLVPRLFLVDDEQPALAANDEAIAFARLRRADGIANFHERTFC